MNEKRSEDKGWMTATTMIATIDDRYDRYGKKRIHSIKFFTDSGKLYYFPQVTFQGAGRFNNKEFKRRGVQPCDCKANPEGHPYPVKITNILQIDGYRVDWSNEHKKL
jgi:hypothetical protein